MNEKKYQLETAKAADVAITKEERYELIALVAQRFDEFKESVDVEDRQVWDSNDTNINFDDFVSSY